MWEVVGGIAAGMAILCSVCGGVWFVVRMSNAPQNVMLQGIREALSKLDADMSKHRDEDAAQFSTVRDQLSTLREDTGSFRRSPGNAVPGGR